jgi:hypothetical protein
MARLVIAAVGDGCGVAAIESDVAIYMVVPVSGFRAKISSEVTPVQYVERLGGFFQAPVTREKVDRTKWYAEG